nr:hypothetical protein GCM10020093_011610 [Planobispora longispora]
MVLPRRRGALPGGRDHRGGRRAGRDRRGQPQDRRAPHRGRRGGLGPSGGARRVRPARRRPLRSLREERTGRERPGRPAEATRSYATLWLDHGVDPVDAGYAYLLLPNASLAGTRARAAAVGRAGVLANTAGQQGVRIPSLGITAVNFWIGGAAGGLTASGPCSVLIREYGDGTATLTVSDPRRDLEELTVAWDRPVTGVLRGHRLLRSATTGEGLILAFGRLADRGGASQTVTVRLRRETP